MSDERLGVGQEAMKRVFGYLASFLALVIFTANVVLATETITYSYDALGRLVATATTGTAPTNGQNVSTSFDPAGNRTNYTVSGVASSTADFSIGTPASVTEGAVMTFTVTRSGVTSTAVSVNYAVTGGTATSGSDYQAVSAGTLNFAANQTSATISVTTIDDTAAESPETIIMTLSNPSPAGSTSIVNASATGTIIDNDSGSTANLAIGNASVTEGGTLAFTVTRSGNTSGAASASYASASGTATSGSDYTAASGTVSFAAGVTSQTINVATVDDAVVESAETMTVTLSNPSQGAAITTATGTGTINDNDSGGGGGSCTPIVPQSYSASSNYGNYYTGLSGTGAGMRDGAYLANSSIHGTNYESSAWIMMDLGSLQTVGSVVAVPAAAAAQGSWGASYLNGAVLQRSSDNVTWTDVATISGATENVQTIVPVNATTRYLRLRQTNYYLGVGDFFASASTCSGGGGSTPTVSIGNASVTEGGNLVFPVTLSAAASGTVTVGYGSASGTATSGSDFTAASGTVTFSAGQTSQSVTVTTIDDAAVESSETMTVTLSGPSGATLGTSSATGTINDNDSSSTANLAIDNASVTEGGTLTFTVTRSGVTTTAVSASYASASGTATSGSDFTAASGTVSFTAGQTSKTISVTTIDDASVESVETLTVALSNPSSGAAITTATGTGTINDNDTALPTVSIANITNGSEPGTNGALTVTQSAASGSNTVVSLSYTGTATSGSDYSAPSSVTIPAGSTSATVTLSVIDDSAVEGSETATVTLSSVTSGTATIGSPSSATNTIGDNDSAPTQIVLTDSLLNVLPAHTSTYGCSQGEVPEYQIYWSACWLLDANNTTVWDMYVSPQLDPGYTFNAQYELQVQSSYYGTGVAP